MRPDQVIDLVREYRRYNYSPHVPSAVVIATADWLAYVQAMAATLPEDDITYPTEEDVLWAWPEGVVIVFAEPVEVQHTIISRSMHGGETEPTPAHYEAQEARALCIIQKQAVPTNLGGPEIEGRVPIDPLSAYPTMWISTDPTDIVQGHWLPGTHMRPAGQMIPGYDGAVGTGEAFEPTGPTSVSGSSLLLVSMITALGHRLTRLAQPSGSRGERRRAERELPGLRVLELASGASVQRNTNSSISYSHRWMVRGHWRLQPHGPGRTLRKPIWIDPYVKGPEGKPLDVRPTLWRT